MFSGMAARTGLVDQAGQDFLARAGFADDEHGAIGARHATRQVHDQPRRCVDGDRSKRLAQTRFIAHLARLLT
jgi:hypothetical protein